MIKQRPEARCWFAYYIFDPIRDLCSSVIDKVATLWIKMKGGWYCEYCHKIHCRRVYKYKLSFSPTPGNAKAGISTYGTLRDIADEPHKYVCSLGRDAITNNTWTPQPTLGDKIQSAFDQVGNIFKV